MRTRLSSLLILAAFACSSSGGGSGGSVTSPPPPPPPPPPPSPAPPAVSDSVWDLNAKGVPKLIAASYIDLSKVEAISRFRSGAGHDYSDDFEHCRSMKHYFRPAGTIDWGSVAISSPVTGRITRVIDEWAGRQIQITASANPAFTIVLFHVAPAGSLAVGDSLSAGDPIGTHVSNATTSDVAVWVQTPAGRALVSYFAALPDSLFAPLVARGVASRDVLIWTRAERDAKPLACDGEAFVGADDLPGWVGLQ